MLYDLPVEESVSLDDRLFSSLIYTSISDRRNQLLDSIKPLFCDYIYMLHFPKAYF
jgi:hypothetical protein